MTGVLTSSENTGFPWRRTFLLGMGGLLSYLLIPWGFSNYNEVRSLREARLARATKFADRNAEFNSGRTMKTLLCSLALLVSVSNPLYAQQTKHEKEEIRKNKIRKVTNVGLSVVTFKFTHEFDRRGNVVLIVGYGSDGAPLLREGYKYDEYDNVIESFKNDKQFSFKLKYDSKGNLIERRQFDQNGVLQQTTHYTVNQRGEVHKSAWHNARGELEGRSETKYSPNGSVLEHTIYKADGTLSAKHVHTYHRPNAVSQSLAYGADGRLARRIVYEYDGERLKQKTTFLPEQNQLYRNTYKRNSEGFVIEDLESDDKGASASITRSTYEFYP